MKKHEKRFELVAHALTRPKQNTTTSTCTVYGVRVRVIIQSAFHVIDVAMDATRKWTIKYYWRLDPWKFYTNIGKVNSKWQRIAGRNSHDAGSLTGTE